MLLCRAARAAYCCFVLISSFVNPVSGQAPATVPLSGPVRPETSKIERQLVDAHGGKEAELRSRLAESLIAEAADLYKQDSLDQAEKNLDRALAQFEQAATIAMATRSKDKQVEIRMRQAARQLSEIARTVPSDNRRHIEDVRESMEKVRARLLDQIFRK